MELLSQSDLLLNFDSTFIEFEFADVALESFLFLQDSVVNAVSVAPVAVLGKVLAEI